MQVKAAPTTAARQIKSYISKSTKKKTQIKNATLNKHTKRLISEIK